MLKQIDTGHFFDEDLYMKVRKIKNQEDSGVSERLGNIDFNDHPLVGKKLTDVNTKSVYEVKSCKKQWYKGGWYYGFIIEVPSGSGSFVWLENINSVNKTILDGIESSRKRFGL